MRDTPSVDVAHLDRACSKTLAMSLSVRTDHRLSRERSCCPQQSNKQACVHAGMLCHRWPGGIAAQMLMGMDAPNLHATAAVLKALQYQSSCVYCSNCTCHTFNPATCCMHHIAQLVSWLCHVWTASLHRCCVKTCIVSGKRL